MVGVTGSIPVAPTIEPIAFVKFAPGRLAGAASAGWREAIIDAAWQRQAGVHFPPGRATHGVEISPDSVATIQRSPQRTIDSSRPTPGTMSPRAALKLRSGPSRIAVLP